MVITFSANKSTNGLRPINPNKDLPQVVDLLHLVFGHEMVGDGNYFQSVIDGSNPSFLWRFDPNLARLSPGFIWVEDNKIVGNVTLLAGRQQGRYLIANVAVHPNFRRQGIARMMMIAALEEVHQNLGREVLLQVVSDNHNAISLYQSIGFNHLGDMTTWQSSVTRIRNLYPSKNQIEVRNLPKNKWKEAYHLDIKALDQNLIWPEPYPNDFYKTTIWSRLVGTLNGQQNKTFVCFGKSGELIGLAAVRSDWGRPHEVILRVDPNHQGTLERSLLNRVINTLHMMSRRNVRLIHHAADEVINELMPEANFSIERTLSHMRFAFR